jgi:hypothetical protein
LILPFSKTHPKQYSLQIYNVFSKKTNSALMKNTHTASHLRSAMNERELQRLIRRVLRDASVQWQTNDGTAITVLSVGEWNHHDGPDFLNMALQAEGKILIGHGEVHWRSSDWEDHGHSAQPMYQGLLLHIVVQDNRLKTPFARHTLVIPEEILLPYTGKLPELAPTLQPREIDDILRDCAEQRFFRKAEFAGALLLEYGADAAWKRLGTEFCEKRLRTKHLPQGIKRLASLLHETVEEKNTGTVHQIKAAQSITAFIEECAGAEFPKIQESWALLLDEAPFGAGTTLEFVVNVLLPLGYARASGAHKQDVAQGLLRWYRTLKAVNRYARLQRKYSFVRQEYVWQQQGLLEYEAEIAAPNHHAEKTLHASSAHGSVDMVMTVFEA